MSDTMPQGPFCQSCSMPLEKPEDFGTGDRGFRINDYCHFCFQNGSFTDPTITMQAMIDKCVTVMKQQGIMPEGQARIFMNQVIPQLKRWQGIPGK